MTSALREKTIKLLRERGERITPARTKIIEILSNSKYPITAGELLLKLKKFGLKADKTTIYRQLDDLVVHGIIEEISFTDRKIRYEIFQGVHHHHLVCTKCGSVCDIELKEGLKNEEKKIEKKTGYKIIRHALEFFGVCKKCLKKGG